MYKIKENIIAIPPGITIKEELNFLEMTQSEFAERMGFSDKHISKIITGDASITPETSLKLETVLNIPSTFWNNLEAEYREQLFKIGELENLSQETEYLRNFPVKDIKKKGWIELKEIYSPQELIIAFRKFFGVTNLLALNNIEKEVFEVNYRKNENKDFCPYAMLSWIRRGEIEFRNLDLEDYNQNLLKNSLNDLKKISINNNSNTLSQVQNILKRCGAGLVIVEHLPKTYVSGITKWIGSKPMIILSTRGKKIDIFWFNLFHELCHVLKHGKKKLYINDKDIISNMDQEKEADEFAKNILLSQNK